MRIKIDLEAEQVLTLRLQNLERNGNTLAMVAQETANSLLDCSGMDSSLIEKLSELIGLLRENNSKHNATVDRLEELESKE